MEQVALETNIFGKAGILAVPVFSIEECEAKLFSLGLNKEEIKEIGESIDLIGEKVFDNYFRNLL